MGRVRETVKWGMKKPKKNSSGEWEQLDNRIKKVGRDEAVLRSEKPTAWGERPEYSQAGAPWEYFQSSRPCGEEGRPHWRRRGGAAGSDLGGGIGNKGKLYNQLEGHTLARGEAGSSQR